MNPPVRGHKRQYDKATFDGFESLGANFVYCPNQFFDVCLPNCSRGTVRLVAYLLRKTLGWLDESGEPVEQDIALSYGELVTKAGISRGAIGKAIDDAIAGGFVRCTLPGWKNADGKAAQTAQYRLRWGSRNEYIKESDKFEGFYVGEGHRTPIPNAFFDHVVIREPLAVVKVVGAVLRHTVGYQNQFGGRRSQAPLSYSYIQKYANLRGRANLSRGLHHATQVGYIRCIHPGCVSPISTERKPATYAVNWLEHAAAEPNGSKKKPVMPGRSKNETSDSSEMEPAERFKKETKEITSSKDTHKQQDDAAADCSESCRLLCKAGFDEATAQKLAMQHSVSEVKNQIDWLEARNPCENRLGMLRKALDEDWSMPPALARKQQRQAVRQQATQQEIQQATEDAAVAARKRERRRRAVALLKHWQRLSTAEQKRHHQTAIDEANSEFLRRKLRAHTELDEPPLETLEVMARDASLR